MDTSQKYVNNLVKIGTFDQVYESVADYLEHASLNQKIDAVRAVIGRKDVSTISPENLNVELMSNYGWNPGNVAAGHYLCILKTGPIRKSRGCR